MKTLEEKLNTLRLANDAYSHGVPFMTDQEYDVLWQDIRELKPNHPELYHTSRDPNKTNSVPHKFPLFSPLKAFSEDDLKPFLQRFKNEPLIIQPKYDGIAAVIYNLGDRCRLVKSGDGVVGEDISHHLPAIDLPDHWKHHPQINVELLILMSNWHPTYGANPRNTVAGWLNRSTPLSKKLITAVDHERNYLLLNIYPPHRLDDIIDTFLHRYADWSTTYPMDGLMVKLQSFERRTAVGHNTRNLLWSLAWKPPISAKWTTVRAIHWNVSRSGRVIPKVEYEPIELCGTMNRFATGNNARWIEAREIGEGAQIKVGKAGEIIPKILDTKAIGAVNLPVRCPICKGYLEWRGVDLLCVSPSCIAKQVKRLAYFYSDKGMEIKSIGEAMLEQLLQNEKCYTILKAAPWALLEPDTFGIYHEVKSIWGEARTETYLDNLADLSNAKNPAHFVAALGYKNLAYKTALACFQAFLGYANPQRSISNSVNSFSLGLVDFKKAMETMRYFRLAEIPKPATCIYCVTGTLSVPRNEMVDYLSAYGWQPMNQISKNVDLLILGELNKESTKLRKAKELGVKIVTEEQLPSLLPAKEETTNHAGKFKQETNSRS